MPKNNNALKTKNRARIKKLATSKQKVTAKDMKKVTGGFKGGVTVSAGALKQRGA